MKGFCRIALISLLLHLFLASPAAGSGSAEAETPPPPAVSQQLFQNLTPVEIEWLQNHPKIRAAGPRAFPPFHFYDANAGETRGISVDYLRLIQERLGIQVEIHDDLPWPEVLEKIENHELDLIPCAAKSQDREDYLLFSRPYLSFPLVIITRKDVPFVGGIQDLNQKSVALIKGVMTHQWLVRDGIDMTPVFVSTPLEGLISVSEGRSEAYIGNLAAVSYMIDEHGLFNLKIAAPTAYSNYELFMAVRHDWPELVSILDKALGILPHTEEVAIRNAWLSVKYEHGLRIRDILLWTGLVIAFFLPLLLVFLYWNRKLKTEVRQRTHIQEILTQINQLNSRLLSLDTTGSHLDTITGSLTGMFDAALACVWVTRNRDPLPEPSETDEGSKADNREPLSLGSASGESPLPEDLASRLMAEESPVSRLLSRDGPGMIRLKPQSGFPDCDQDWFKAAGIVTIDGCRLMGSSNEPLGILVLFCRQELSDDDSSLLEGVTRTLSRVIETGRIQSEKEQLIIDLQQALSEIRTLSGLLPICASCKKIRDDKGYWNQIEQYIERHSQAVFSHSICPDCIESLYGRSTWFTEGKSGSLHRENGSR